MTKRVRVEWLQSHVRNARGILFLLNKLHVKKESFSCSLSGCPIPDVDTFSPQVFWQCFLLSFECQFLEADGNKGVFFLVLLQPGHFKLKVPFTIFWLNPAQDLYALLAACFTHGGRWQSTFLVLSKGGTSCYAHPGASQATLQEWTK